MKNVAERRKGEASERARGGTPKRTAFAWLVGLN